MRTAFIKTLCELAEKNKNIWLLTGDLGYNVLEPFLQHFPDRFVNVGVAEQNMIGVATGLALSGKIVFVYSIANFPTLRCLEQIRNDICYHKANVKIVAVGGGLVYGVGGITHYATEDLSVMRSLPNMVVIAPADPIETTLAVQNILNYPFPCYLRLSKANDPIVHKNTPNFQIGKAIELKNGYDVTLIGTGGMVYNCLKVAEILEKEGISTRVLSMHTIKPLDREAISLAAIETKIVLTIEEHVAYGGLSSAVAEVISQLDNKPIYFRSLSIGDSFCQITGGQEYLRQIYGLSIEGIYNTVKKIIRSCEGKN